MDGTVDPDQHSGAVPRPTSSRASSLCWVMRRATRQKPLSDVNERQGIQVSHRVTEETIHRIPPRGLRLRPGRPPSSVFDPDGGQSRRAHGGPEPANCAESAVGVGNDEADGCSRLSEETGRRHGVLTPCLDEAVPPGRSTRQRSFRGCWGSGKYAAADTQSTASTVAPTTAMKAEPRRPSCPLAGASSATGAEAAVWSYAEGLV